MAIKYLEDGRISDDFEMGSHPHVLRDAIVMHPEKYAKLTPDEISTIKQSRYDKWIAIITAPPVEAPYQEETSLVEQI